MMTNTFRILLAMLISAWLQACGDAAIFPTQAIVPTPVPNTYFVKGNWQFRWVEGIPCKAPCWENIMLGKTSGIEAINILRGNTLVISNSVKLSTSLSSSKHSIIEWKWSSATARVQVGGEIHYTSDEKSKVYWVRPAYDQSMQEYLFTDIIAQYGEPTHIYVQKNTLASNTKTSFTVFFIYLQNGFLVKTNLNSALKIDKNIRVGWVEFFIPGLDTLLLATAVQRIPLLWEGFNSPQYYCEKDTNCKGVINN
jgi:hypothetical protein